MTTVSTPPGVSPNGTVPRPPVGDGEVVTGAEILLESLRREGVDTIFGYPGGANLPLYQHLPTFPDLHHVLARHEQGATHMADGYARAKRGSAGVVFATSGPGALNCVTGIATAQYDSVPLVVITGQVATAAVGTDAFQESDVIGVTMPIVKHSYLVQDVGSLARVVREAFHIATTGRPGVVLIDLPKDVQQARGAFHWPSDPQLRSYNPTVRGNPLQIRKAAHLIDEARRPVLLAGRGVLISRAEDELLELSRRASVPVGWTLLGTGAYPVGSELSLHMVGFMGAGYTNKAVLGCDLLVMVGMRADDRVTTKLDSFAPQVENIIHIDIDPAEIGKNVRPTLPIVGDARQVLGELARLVQPKRLDSWITQIDAWKEEHPIRYRRGTGVLQPQDVLTEMYRRCDGGEAIVVTDVGQNQIWGALWWDFPVSGLFLNSGGAGTMGFSFPAALGARRARPDRRVWCVAGEGGFVMTMQELATAVEENLDVKVVILNNYSLGMVRQFQDDYYGGIRNAVDLHVGPDFVKLADAFGMPGWRTDRPEEVGAILDRMAAHPGPCIGEFTIDPEANVRPIIPLGKGLPDFVEEMVEEGF